MSTRKLCDYNKSTNETEYSWCFEQCRNPDHKPDLYVSRQPGFYEHKCSRCGMITVFRIT